MDTISLQINLQQSEQHRTGCLDDQTFQRLAALVPHLCRYGNEITYYGPADEDCHVSKVIDFLIHEGINVFDPYSGNLGPFVSRSRNYTSKELDSVEYIYKPEMSVKLGGVSSPYATNDMGMPIFDRSMVPQTRLIGTARSPLTHGCMLCRGEAAEKIATWGMIGASLVGAPVSNRGRVEVDQTVRVVWSDRVLPPALNLMLAKKGACEYSEIRPDEPDTWFNEGFSLAEIHYNRDDLTAFGDFDVALMREQTRMNGHSESQLVISQRFRQLLKQEFNVNVNGIPVRIRDDRQIPWAGPYPTGWEHKNVRPEWLSEFEKKRNQSRQNQDSCSP